MTIVIDHLLQGRGTVLATQTEAIDVLAGAGVCSLDGVALLMWMDGADLNVDGEILGHGTGAWIIGNDATVTIGASGQIGANSFERAMGLDVQGGGLRVENDGYIIAYDTAIRLIGGNGTTSTFENRGAITGNLFGIFREPGDGEAAEDKLVIVNEGSISGTKAAIAQHDWVDAREVVLNSGIIQGDVSLGLGKDLYDGRDGEIQGRVLLGGGNDVARPGESQETIQGGAGTDTLDFGGSRDGFVLSLADGRLNAGAAKGDAYSGFENIIGGSGADDLAGNGAANALDGEDGADLLRAGAGGDALTGGSGNDVFVFTSRDGTDRVTDFSAAPGDNDRIQILRSAFGLSVAAGRVDAECFVIRDDNKAQEADDHLIFRTTDRTLWVDADGSGSGAAVRLAAFDGTTPLTLQDLSFL